jgi:hypothetical protein
MDHLRSWNQVSHENAAGLLQRLDYLHNDVGLITSVTSVDLQPGVASPEDHESWTYSYDGLDRLRVANNLGASSYDHAFTYAPNGNMLSASRLGTYTYPATTADRPHAPLTAGSRTYSYDGNGNALSDGTTAYRWDGSNRLTAATGVSFAYGPDGSRSGWCRRPARSGPSRRGRGSGRAAGRACGR